MKDYGPSARHTRRIIMEWLSDLSFKSVLDVSCGSGQLLAIIRNNYPTTKLTGTEFTEKNVTTNRHYSPEINFMTFDLETDGALEQRDLILCIDVLEHIADDQLALHKLKAMTGKYLLLAVPLGRVSRNERLSLGHLHGYSPMEFDYSIEQANLKIVKSLQWGFPFYRFTRFITTIFNKSPAEGKITTKKMALFKLLFFLYKFNLPFLGGRYFVLCTPSDK